ncbi:MAG: hypothetical protein II427_00250, partial [Firmicutes bacterium]|nr:hypothetical protein [Bacillota bacterium]
DDKYLLIIKGNDIDAKEIDKFVEQHSVPFLFGFLRFSCEFEYEKRALSPLLIWSYDYRVINRCDYSVVIRAFPIAALQIHLLRIRSVFLNHKSGLVYAHLDIT